MLPTPNLLIMGKASWIRSESISDVERRVGTMLRKMKVRFRHHEFVAGREVDFLVPRPGRRGLIVEVDGDFWHSDEVRRSEKDQRLQNAGWDVIHFWGSEVEHTPEAVRQRLWKELEGVPRIRRRSRRKD